MTDLAEEKHSPFEFDNIHFDKLKTNRPNTLESHMLYDTVSIRKVRQSSRDPNTQQNIRRYFFPCCVLFCTDSHCSLPLHTLVTDLVENQGGSTSLVRILNRLGVCASADTLARFIQYKVNTRESITPEDTGTFTIISADNIDFLHSYSRVFQGKQTSSWDGTSVQVVQPLPSLEHLSMEDSSLAPIDVTLTETDQHSPLGLGSGLSVTHLSTRSNQHSCGQSTINTLVGYKQ